MAGAEKWRVSRWRNRLLGAAGVLLLLEVGCRVFLPVPVQVPRQSVGGAVHLKPNVTFETSGEDFRNVVVTNSQGFHDREHPARKEPGVRRVVVLGDSMVEAVQVPRSQNLCSRLEATLGEGTEVLNMGIAGAGQAQEYLVLQDQAARAEPDVVVLCVYATNDVYNNSPRLEAKRDKPFFVEREGRLELVSGGMAVRPEPWLEGPLWEASGLYRLVVRNVHGLRERPVADPHEVFAAAVGPEWDEAWSVTRALLRAMGEETRAQGARLLVVLLPGREQLRNGTDESHRRLASVCRELGLECLDLVPTFRAASGKLYFARDEHLTAEGHALVAREVAGRLR